MSDSRLAMSTWVGALAKTGVLSHSARAHEEAGVALAAFVVGESRIEDLRRWLESQPVEILVREKRAAIEVCIWMANADRKLDPEEAYLLRTLVGSSGLDDDTVDELVASIHDLPSLDGIETRLTHPVLRELMLALCWELASADGEVDRLEEAFHVGLARRLEIDSHRAKELRDAMNQRISLAP
jgi:uncharacterized tellurite resistance protein B-like protein